MACKLVRRWHMMQSVDCMCDDGREAATTVTLEAELFVCSVVMHMAACTLQHMTVVAHSSLHQSDGCARILLCTDMLSLLDLGLLLCCACLQDRLRILVSLSKG